MFRSLILFIGLATAAIAGSSEWTEFRGTTRQGHSDARDLPTHWSSTSNVTWKVPIPGRGWSSPIVYGGVIYVTTAVPNGPAIDLTVMALDAKTGQAKWTTPVFDNAAPGAIHQKNSHASPTPVVSDGKLFVHFGHQGTASLALDGKVIWKNKLSYPPVHGSGGSPLVLDDKIILSCDGAADPFVVALSKTDGNVIWKTPRGIETSKKFAFSTPLLIEASGRPEVILPASGAVCSYAPTTGEELWRVRYDGYSVIPRPVFGKGLIFVSTGYDRPIVLAIRPGGTGDVTDSHVAWKLTRGAPQTPSMLLIGDELYLVSDAGIASCVDAATGKSHWQERVGGDCSASPIFADGKIYFQTEDGTGVVIEPGRAFKKLATNKLEERTLASYAVVDGALFIRGEENLYRIGEKP